MKKLQINTPAPDFTLPDQDGTPHNLSDYRGGWVLLYFYPKDDTPGCTAEACGIQDSFSRFKKLGTAVLGISVDSIKSHKKFAQKYGLDFTLLSDADEKVVRDYGVWAKKRFMGRPYYGTARTSFLIDRSGRIAKIYEKVDPANHANTILQDLENLL